MRKLVAKGISFRLLALVCFGLGAAWTYWTIERARETQMAITVYPLPKPKTLDEKRRTNTGVRWSGGEYGGHITTCGAIYYTDDNPKLTEVERLRLKACQIESEQARKFVERNWRDKSAIFMEVQHPCPDCRIVYDVLIEKNKEQNWQITIWRRPDDDGDEIPSESVAVGLRRRPATGYDFEKHAIGESVLAFLDSNGKEILSL